MGISRWFRGRDESESREGGAQPVGPGRRPEDALTDEQAIDRYRYMLRTAPPETIEQAHAEAFARLTDRQRRMVLEQLREATPEPERATATADDPRTLARLATRAEVRQPGTLERVFGSAGGMGGPGFGGVLAGSFLSSLAGTVIGSMIAQQFLTNALDRGAGLEHGSYHDETSAANAADPDRDTHVAGDFDADTGGDFDVEV
jgi:hypothetical protein